MGSLRPENLCFSNRKRAVEELVKGRDNATQLQILLENPSGGHGSVSAEDLALNILRSFTNTLSLFEESGEVRQIPVDTQVGTHARFGDRKSVDSGQSSKRLAVKDRRGGYKRRKNSYSWKKVSPKMEDGHAWRKYGQKLIQNAKYPRCYFRCTHKYVQGCQATKQVQKVQEDPQLFQITYNGQHTCKLGALGASSHDPVESHLLSFESKNISGDPHHHHISYPLIPLKKEEIKNQVEEEEERESNVSVVQPDNILIIPTLEEYSSVGAETMLSPKMTRSNHQEDGISRSTSVYSAASTSVSYDNLDMDFLIDESVDFDPDILFS